MWKRPLRKVRRICKQDISTLFFLSCEYVSVSYGSNSGTDLQAVLFFGGSLCGGPGVCVLKRIRCTLLYMLSAISPPCFLSPLRVERKEKKGPWGSGEVCDNEDYILSKRIAPKKHIRGEPGSRE